MALPSFMQLPGPHTEIHGPLKSCNACGFNQLFKQPDFNRNLGLWLVGFASVLTVVFAISDFDWFIVWSPMPAFFILDRVFAKKSSTAILCYKCEHIHRSPDSEAMQQNEISEFDLDTYDRIHYQDRISKQAP
jgi:hypothetical protein